jgi:CHASE3 domain sensor protein
MTEETSPSNRSLSARLAKLERAAEGHERNASDLARVFTQFSQDFTERMKALETDRQERRIAEAATAVKDEQLKNDVHEIKLFMKGMQDGNIVGKVQDMSGGFNRLFWLVIGAVVAGGVGLIFLAMRGAL